MNKAIRLMGFKKKHDSVKSFFNYYGLLNFGNMIKINKGKFMSKLVNKEEPESIQMKYHLREINALNKNKDKNRYIFPYFRTIIGKLSLHYQGIHLWNSEIPREIKNVRNIKLFTKQLKDYTLKKNFLEYNFLFSIFLLLLYHIITRDIYTYIYIFINI